VKLAGRNGRTGLVGLDSRRRRTVGATTAPIVVSPVSDRGRRLSDGVLVEASVIARLLRIRLLTLDATVLLVPAGVTESTTAIDGSRDRARPRPSEARPSRSRSAEGLAEAVRSINEGAELLARARHHHSLLPSRDEG
jgi:hypothetical protein